MIDRLRAVECPKEIIDQIGGWSSSDVWESYGEGFPLNRLYKWFDKMLRNEILNTFKAYYASASSITLSPSHLLDLS